MTYATLMIDLELGKSNADVLKVAADLAGRFDAGVVGVAACEGPQLAYGGPYVTAEAVDLIQRQTSRLLHEAEAEFRALLSPRVASLEWRAAETYEPTGKYLAAQARRADLIIAAAGKTSGDLVMQAGRPVLLVPSNVAPAAPERVLVAWKDTREARRAALDALPLLRVAQHVVVVEVAPAEQSAQAKEHLSDITAWLGRHGIVSHTEVVPAKGADADAVARAANAHQADVIVAGAYGHGRLREWALGGVTFDLLLNTRRLVLLSH